MGSQVLIDDLFIVRFLYTLFLAVDANFKLKGKARGLKDIELMPGWAFCVEETAYQKHLLDYVDEPEVRIKLVNVYLGLFCFTDQYVSL